MVSFGQINILRFDLLGLFAIGVQYRLSRWHRGKSGHLQAFNTGLSVQLR